MKIAKSILLAALLASTSAAATEIYKCGNTYTDTPCGKRIVLNVAHPSADERVHAVERHYAGVIEMMKIDHARREFELARAYIQSSKVTQVTQVTATSESK